MQSRLHACHEVWRCAIDMSSVVAGSVCVCGVDVWWMMVIDMLGVRVRVGVGVCVEYKPSRFILD